jgi:hypothetical protein
MRLARLLCRCFYLLDFSADRTESDRFFKQSDKIVLRFKVKNVEKSTRKVFWTLQKNYFKVQLESPLLHE